MQKYDIVLVDLNPVRGSEQKGIRPCLVVQNNLANQYSRTTVICPISSVIKRYPHTLIIEASKTNGLSQQSRIDLLQIRTIDKARINKKLGSLDKKYHAKLRHCFFDAFDLRDLFLSNNLT